ncbi:hypothetical protein [Nocardia sp. NPDC051981]|uniref:hypothetical protein n=1 Tax=Nocardia sp. NPDC051981 TaxID=3155417 RepID=UPI0034498660
MTGFVLTPDRRDRLAALLGDEQRLRAEYPKVADYLDTAPMIPGSGDEQADAAFDLRFLNYMTGDSAESRNPYWDIVAPSVSTRDGRRVVNGGRPEGSARLGLAQIGVVERSDRDLDVGGSRERGLGAAPVAGERAGRHLFGIQSPGQRGCHLAGDSGNQSGHGCTPE